MNKRRPSTQAQRPEEISAARRVGEALQAAIARLEAAGLADARRNAEWMLCHLLGIRRAQLYAYPEAPLPPEAAARLDAFVARRRRREPLQYVLGEADFMALTLRVTPAVLIPRPETEQLVVAALERLGTTPAPRVLDVGTGSGCVALAVQHERPEAYVLGVDVSEAALAVARDNGRRLGLKVAWASADVLAADFAGRVGGGWHLVVSNPPYVPVGEAAALEPEVRDFEPALALFEPGPLAFYHALARQAPALLAPGGWLVVEVHDGMGEAVAALWRAADLEEVALTADLSGRRRLVAGRYGV